MAELSKTVFEGKFNSASVGLLKDNTTNDIVAANTRTLVTDLKDSFAAHPKVYTVATSGGTITLDFEEKEDSNFVGSASFSTAKAVAFANDTNAIKFQLGVEITDVAATLDFGSGSVFKSTSNDFNASTQVFTFSFTGFILITGRKIGSNWWLTVEGPFA